MVPAIHHILPDEHPKPVTMIIPPVRLNLGMLTQHIEAKGFHLKDVVHHRLIRWRGIQAIRIIPLIKHTVMVIRHSVQKQPDDPFGIFLDGYLSHGEV